MSRMNCKCGNVLSNSETPSHVKLIVYSDIEWDAIMSVRDYNLVTYGTYGAGIVATHISKTPRLLRSLRVTV